MNYELAKQLKDAGFPQTKTVNRPLRTFYTEDGLKRFEGIHDYPKSEYEKMYKVPTLSELIEVCGDAFMSLTLVGETWSAIGGGVDYNGVGKTPEEAVARLWLELNK